MGRKVYVIGVGMTKFEKPGSKDWDYPDMALEAGTKALEDAGVPYEKIEQAFVGYCYGGSVSWLAATRLDFAAVVSYYGGNVAEFADEQAKCPVIMHIGDQDNSIDAGKIETIKNAQPDIPVYIYEGAGHGFNCEQRGSYHQEATKVARGRSLEFLAEHIG